MAYNVAADSDNAEPETMFIHTKGDWTADELEKLLWSVKTIHDVYTILDMAKNHELHDRSFDTILNQLSKADSMTQMLDWKEVFDPVEPLYQARGKKRRISILKLFDLEFFGILQDFIHDSERLLVKKIDMGSPGGITFSRRIKRFPNEPVKEQKTPLSETKNFVKTIISKEKNMQRELVVENRALDPRLLELTGQILFDGPVNIISDLARHNKIGVDDTDNKN